MGIDWGFLDSQGDAVRTEAHCGQPILARFWLESSVLPSFAFYNTRDGADALVEALRKIGGITAQTAA